MDTEQHIVEPPIFHRKVDSVMDIDGFIIKPDTTPVIHDHAENDDDQSSDNTGSYLSSITSSPKVSSSNDESIPIQPTLGEYMATEWGDEKERTVNEPYEYVCSLGGKGFRKHFAAALNVWLQVDNESIVIINKAVGMLHNASLMIDDIQDGSKLRRGSASTHEVYGVASTINSANLVYFQAQEQLRQLEHWPEALSIFNEELINLHRGQGMELYWRDHSYPPSEPDYLQMISNKTGGLFRLLLRLMQLQSSYKTNLTPLVDCIGLMFQIIDDYLNLKDSKVMQNEKGFCEDLTEGKFSYPVSLAIWNKIPQTDEILEILKSRSEDNERKAYVVSCLEKEGVFEQARLRIQNSHEEILQMLSEVPERNPSLEKLIQALISKVDA